MTEKQGAKKATNKSAGKKTPKITMPAAENRRGGLGRGLSALIPQGPAKPKLGNDAADIILGGPQPAAPAEAEAPAASSGDTRGTSSNHKPTATVNEAGRGGEKTAVSAIVNRGENEFGAHYLEIPIEEIRENPKQPRQHFDEGALEELVHSIREFGLMQPVVVRENDGAYELIMGERRLRASKKVGLTHIPAIVRETADDAMLRDALLENIHRVQLNPIEEAMAYQQLLEEFGVTHNELADRIGRSRPVITNMLRLLKLPVLVQTRVAAGVLSSGHARAIAGLNGGESVKVALANRVVAEGLSVRATEEAVVLLNRGDAPKKQKREKAPTPEHFTHAVDQLANGLDTKVHVSVGKRKGRVVIEFAGQDDFDRIMGILSGSEG